MGASPLGKVRLELGTTHPSLQGLGASLVPVLPTGGRCSVSVAGKCECLSWTSW